MHFEMKLPVIAAGVVAAALGLVLQVSAATAATPDFTGVWARSFAPRPGAPPADPRLTPPPPADPELTPAYAADYAKLRAAERESDKEGKPIGEPSTECLPDGMPQMMFAIYPLEILQTPGQVTMIEEAYSEVRRVFLGKPQLAMDDVPPGYYGHSVGHWEGDVLVIDTIGVKESVRGYKDVPHSDQMRIEERMSLAAPDILQDQITIVDPKVLVKPWTFTFAYKRKPDYEMLEYVCENNREYLDEHGVTHIRLGGQ
jgi:hypothetical protein